MSGIDLTEAVEAALEAHRHPRRMLTNTSDGNRYDRMEAALEAALPHLEQQIRAQVAAEIEAGRPETGCHINVTDRRDGIYYGMTHAADIARTRKDT